MRHFVGIALNLVSAVSASEFGVHMAVQSANTCRGSQVDWGICPVREGCSSCSPVNCALGQWSPYSDCDCSGLKSRSRVVVQDKNECGEPCKGVLTETLKCKVVHCREQKDCKLSPWSAWSAGAGGPGAAAGGEEGCVNFQMKRTREIEQLPKNGGAACSGPMEQTAPCGNPPPMLHPRDCQLSAWHPWGSCSATCGTGRRTRQRTVLHEAVNGGAPCTGDLTVTENCGTEESRNTDACPDDDPCIWDTWAEWSACSCTCGGGQKRRERQILQSPKGLGQLCEARTKKEIAPCNVQSCGASDRDGKWGQWQTWGKCSQPCDGGVQKRKRVMVVQAQGSGRPAEGTDEEYRACNAQACDVDVDCLFDNWGHWSTCSCSCNGVKHRSRAIRHFGAGRHGKSCTGAVHEISPCNAGDSMPAACGVEKIDCALGAWSTWGECSATCGSGQRQRTREVARQAVGLGEACRGVLSELRPCHKKPCIACKKCGTKVLDCKWGQWEHWGHCDTCTGQKRRVRMIAQMPENGGRPCDARPSEELKDCLYGSKRQCGDQYWCVWTGWSGWDETTCPSGCDDKGVRKRHRGLKAFKNQPGSHASFVAVSKASACQSATQHEEEMCPVPRSCFNQEDHCVDCAAGPWSPWASCDCTGLRTRQRSVAQSNNECGTPCSMVLSETQRCRPSCRKPPHNCVVGSWSEWKVEGDEDSDIQGCAKNPTGQKFRTREIVREATRGGIPCEGVLSETVPCGGQAGPHDPIACVLSDWSAWTRCSVTCGSGTLMRTRQIAQHSARGGAPCEGNVMETDDCTGETGECKTDTNCVWGVWNEWSPCTCKCGGGQKRRSRQIEKYPTGSADMCPENPSAEIAPCNTQSCEGACVDGKWGSWTEWTQCSRSCNGGLRWRSRDVDQIASSCGKPVEGKASQFDVCNEISCEHDQPCLFSAWGHWSDCSCTCNGVKHRSRSIRQYGKAKGKFCEGPIHEITSCNAGDSLPDGCTDPAGDCALSAWTHWSACSATCGTGQKMRSRKIAQEAFGGGHACPDVALTEMGQCNARRRCQQEAVRNCEWSAWGAWGHCDKCGGQKRRFRYITQMPENGGSPCGDVEVVAEEVAKCKRQCHEPIYCTWTHWGEWGACPQTCDPHTRKRERHLTVTHTEPADSEVKFQQLRIDNESLTHWNSAVNMLVVFACATTLILGYMVFQLRKEAITATRGAYVSANAATADPSTNPAREEGEVELSTPLVGI